MFKKPIVKFKARFYFLQAISILIVLVIIGQLFNLQILRSAGLVSKLNNRSGNKEVTLRGDIRDRFGNLLVLDLIKYDIYNNVRDLNSLDENEIITLSKVLNIATDELIEKLKQKIDTRIIKSINEHTAGRIKELNLSFIYLVPQLSRKYPNNYLASHIIGFVNSDHIGQHGSEYTYNELLKKHSTSNSKDLPFPKGTSIVLTIDSILQKYSENVLEKTIKKTKAQKGSIIVMSPKTGEVYSWAIYPTFNPNIYFKEKNTKNWSITDIYEPGSTFKPITIASALELMTIQKDSKFLDEGKIVVSRRTIRNHHMTEPQELNLLEVFKQSSNIASAKIGLSMKPKDFHNYIKKFMIGVKTKVDLPGESQGLLLDHKKWREIDSASTGIGQGAISVTPIQLASSISVFANNGIWTQPHILKGIWQPTYMIITDNPLKIEKARIISEDTASFVSMLLGQSVEENLADKKYIAGNVPGYKVAGKTGTAQKIRPDGKGYWFGHTVASFVGYFPAEDPQLLILAVIDDPKTDGRWGNTVAGPVFNDVARFAARRYLD